MNDVLEFTKKIKFVILINKKSFTKTIKFDKYIFK